MNGNFEHPGGATIRKCAISDPRAAKRRAFINLPRFASFVRLLVKFNNVVSFTTNVTRGFCFWNKPRLRVFVKSLASLTHLCTFRAFAVNINCFCLSSLPSGWSFMSLPYSLFPSTSRNCLVQAICRFRSDFWDSSNADFFWVESREEEVVTRERRRLVRRACSLSRSPGGEAVDRSCCRFFKLFRDLSNDSIIDQI